MINSRYTHVNVRLTCVYHGFVVRFDAIQIASSRRTLIPEYEALMARVPGSDVLHDLDAVRGER